jgi:hypothetical protein
MSTEKFQRKRWKLSCIGRSANIRCLVKRLGYQSPYAQARHTCAVHSIRVSQDLHLYRSIPPPGLDFWRKARILLPHNRNPPHLPILANVSGHAARRFESPPDSIFPHLGPTYMHLLINIARVT